MPMEDAANFEKTLELGKQLVHTLDETDLLWHWMAHHLADLITKAETAEGERANESRQQAVDLILRLWEHRSTLPSRHRPMASFEPVMSALAKLSEPHEPWRHSGIFEPGQEPDETDLASVALLRHTLQIEAGLLELIHDVVAYATRVAENKERNWITASRHLEEDSHLRARRALHQFSRRLDRDYALLKADEEPDETSDSDLLMHAIARLERSLQDMRIEIQSLLSPNSKSQ